MDRRLSDDEHSRSASTRPSPHDLPTFVPYACFQLEAPFSVKVNVEVQGEYQKVEGKPKKARRSIAPVTPPASDSHIQESDIATGGFYDDTVVVLTAVMDSQGRLVELVFHRCVEIPRLLIKIIGICMPYQSTFYKLTVRWGPLTTDGLYEFGKILKASQLSEICLDDSPVAGRNYEVLLEPSSNLRCLSLNRCKLDNDDCIKIANLLKHPLPAGKTLCVLSLASNSIGDRGASALGGTLRTNRTLRYLNLAGNHITDIGANFIFKSLMEFAVTQKEIQEKRTRYLDYLQLRNNVYKKCYKEVSNSSHDEARMTRRRTVLRVNRKMSIAAGMSAADVMHTRAEAMTLELVGFFSDPFCREFVTQRDGQLYCVGNLCLTCLNLSYNNLQYASVGLLHDVLMYQSWVLSKASSGLLRINIEGNDMPAECDEWALIDELVERAHAAKARPNRRASERIKSRASRVN